MKIPISFIPGKRRAHRKRQEVASASPSPPPPPPPPAPPVHVVAVTTSPGEPTVATWLFDLDIDDPTTLVIGLVVNGHGGTSWERDDTSALRVEHGAAVDAGMSWSNTAFAGGIKSTDGGTLDAGSGTVVEAP